MPLDAIRLDVRVEDHAVPALLFVPKSEVPLPLVLLGHGVHLSKDDEVMQMLARGIAAACGRGRAHGLPRPR